jgi:hypothetical protein
MSQVAKVAEEPIARSSVTAGMWTQPSGRAGLAFTHVIEIRAHAGPGKLVEPSSDLIEVPDGDFLFLDSVRNPDVIRRVCLRLGWSKRSIEGLGGIKGWEEDQGKIGTGNRS